MRCYLVHFERCPDWMPSRRSQGKPFLGIRQLCLPQNFLRARRSFRLAGRSVDTTRENLREADLVTRGTQMQQHLEPRHARHPPPPVCCRNTSTTRHDQERKEKKHDSREAGACPQQPWGGPHTCRGRAEKVEAAHRQAATTGFRHSRPCCQAMNTPYPALGSTPAKN